MKMTLLATSLLTLALASPAALAAERHPEIHAAQRALANAGGHLAKAAHDFGGHRVHAMELIRQAQAELHEALEYAEHRSGHR